MMKTILMIIFCLLLIQGCSENNNPITGSGSSIYGKWEVTSGNFLPYTKYLRINNDNTWYRLIEYNSGTRSVRSGVCEVHPTQIAFSYEGNMNYTISGNELRLTHPDYNLTAVRNPSVPESHEWVITASIVDSIIAESYITRDIAFDGENIWWTNSNRLIKLNTLTKTESSFPVGRSIRPIEWDGSSLWSSSSAGIGYDELFKIDPSNGNIITSYQLNSIFNIEALAFDGTYLWCFSGHNFKLNQYQPDSNKVVSQTDFISTISPAMTFAEGYLYVIDYNLIYKCVLNPIRAVATYEIKNLNLSGIAYYNGTFWVSSRNFDGNKTVDKLYKISL
jgi:hypothetical protein